MLSEKEGKRVFVAIGEQLGVVAVNVNGSVGINRAQLVQREDVIEVTVCQQDADTPCALIGKCGLHCLDRHTRIHDESLFSLNDEIAVGCKRIGADRTNFHVLTPPKNNHLIFYHKFTLLSTKKRKKNQELKKTALRAISTRRAGLL
jgi:hypothetical protein